MNIITTLYEFCTTPRVKPPSHVANGSPKQSQNTETRQTNNNVQAPTEIAIEQLKELTSCNVFLKEYKLGAQCGGSTMVQHWHWISDTLSSIFNLPDLFDLLICFLCAIAVINVDSNIYAVITYTFLYFYPQ